ncbi:hypothetical protein H2203_008264 [Taxawa tesnikishii (nom. ined.)]|nr:hypothetical protein H2203_008264 [Dothideales sp. JES 119]
MASSRIMFKIAAILNALSVAGHMEHSFRVVHKAISTISSPHNPGARRAAEVCVDYVNGSLVIAALLNWQWARTGGPTTKEERAMFWTFLVTHLWSGFRYFQIGVYPPLGSLWGLRC